jgi:hypothetical protein
MWYWRNPEKYYWYFSQKNVLNRVSGIWLFMCQNYWNTTQQCICWQTSTVSVWAPKFLEHFLLDYYPPGVFLLLHSWTLVKVCCTAHLKILPIYVTFFFKVIIVPNLYILPCCCYLSFIIIWLVLSLLFKKIWVTWGKPSAYISAIICGFFSPCVILSTCGFIRCLVVLTHIIDLWYLYYYWWLLLCSLALNYGRQTLLKKNW